MPKIKNIKEDFLCMDECDNYNYTSALSCEIISNHLSTVLPMVRDVRQNLWVYVL